MEWTLHKVYKDRSIWVRKSMFSDNLEYTADYGTEKPSEYVPGTAIASSPAGATRIWNKRRTAIRANAYYPGKRVYLGD